MELVFRFILPDKWTWLCAHNDVSDIILENYITYLLYVLCGVVLPDYEKLTEG